MKTSEKYKIALLEFFECNPRSTINACTRKTGVTYATIVKYFALYGEGYFRGHQVGRG